MMQILEEFQWASTDSYLDITHQKTKPVCFQSNKQGHGVETKNHVYMLTNCPDTYEAMLRYVGYSDLEDADTTEDQKIEHMAQAIHFMAQDMQKSLLGNYIQRQISFNWINTCEGNEDRLKYKSLQKPISNGLCKFLAMFGGHMIPYYIGLINHAKYGCSFSTLFSGYYSSEIGTITKQNKRQIVDDNHTLESYTSCMKPPIKQERSFWEGSLHLGHHTTKCTESDLNKAHKVKLKAFFRTTHELSLDKRRVPSSIQDVFARASTLETIAVIRNSDIQAHWFKDRFEEDKRLEFAMSSAEHDQTGFMELADSLVATHQALVVDLQTHRAFRSTRNPTRIQALVQPLAPGYMNITLLTKSIQEGELQRLDSIPRLASAEGSDTPQLDFGSLVELAPLSMCSIDQYLEAKPNPPRIILHRSGEVEELLMRHKERKLAQEDLKANYNSKKNEIQITEVADPPLVSLPKDKSELFGMVRTLYLEALYIGKWTHHGMMKSLITCVNAATSFCDISEIIHLLGLWTKGWVDIDNHHKEISKYLNHKRANISYNETRYVKIWKKSQLANATDSRKSTLLKWLKIRETKLQIILYLTIISLKRISKPKDLVKNDENCEDVDGVKNWRPMDRYSKIPEELVDIFFDRIQIWGISSSIYADLEEIDSERETCTAIMRIDPADMDLHTFVEDVADCFSATLPNIVKSYREKISDNGKQNKQLEAAQQFSICNKMTNPSKTVNIKGGWSNFEGKPFDYHSVSSLEKRLERARIEDLEDKSDSPRLPKMARVDSAVLADRLFQDEMVIDRNFPKFGENCESGYDRDN
ncbi:hypothetical protein CLU79DRAFT_766476 [Phycomyces nitens]|nr:hypothetical protein CLU79DRAFT_766476 [Phycomyces nitens]